MIASPPSGFLALPRPGKRTLSSLRRKVRLLGLRTLLLARPEDRSLARALSPVQDLLSRLAASHKRDLLDAIGSPDVLPLLLTHASGLLPPEGLLARAVPQLLVELQVRGALVEPLLWEHPVGSLVFHGKHRFDPAASALLVDAGGVEVSVSGSKRALGPADSIRYALAAPSLHLSLVDGNPLAMQEAHPDKQGNALSLGDRTPEAWQEALDEALGLVEQTLPTWFSELAVSLDRIVPVGFEPERHLSASYREAPGLCYLTLHPDPLTLAEALVHETQHNKINLLSWLDPVLHNAHSTWARSPVRPDLRPLWGILLAVHAFVPVAALHRQLLALDHPLSRSPVFERRRLQVLAGNERGLQAVLEHARPTAAGDRVLTALRELHAFALADVDADLDPAAVPPG